MPATPEIPVLSLEQRGMSNTEKEHLNPLSWQRIYDEAKHAVVQVCGTDDENPREGSCGSGFFVDKKGVVATDLHVVKGLDDIEVTTYTGRKFHARTIGVQENSGLALLQLTNAQPTEKFHALTLASGTAALTGGEDVAALGYPNAFGKEFLSPGRFSNKAMLDQIRPLLKQPPSDSTSGSQLLLITNMLTKKGNSGGPMLDRQGNVVGICRYADSLRFSIAARVEELAELVASKKQTK